MIYVSRDIKRLYLSYDSMIQLGIISRDFPTVGLFVDDQENQQGIPKKLKEKSNQPVGSICGATKDD